MRALVQSGTIQAKDVAQVERRMMNPARGAALNKIVHLNRGQRFVDKLRSLVLWTIKHRDEIMSVLGFIVMFADDGKPYLKDKDEHEAELAAAERDEDDGHEDPEVVSEPEREPYETTIDVTDGRVGDIIVTSETVISREDAEKSLDKLIKLNESEDDFVNDSDGYPYSIGLDE